MDEANVLMNAGVFWRKTSEARESVAIGVYEKQSGKPSQSQERSAIQFLYQFITKMIWQIICR